ncbi:RnfABCDGE type electron transport complex subunit E [candidate division WOR-3 bacterium]|uniref:Ion-translocating oxidoreductase complex subunit E n=1 Tax=candidate division WOR-3 bacterium TaxID=2052148 RepID=A0A938BT86_UNCW3|nr:RnfABCDGE type electron transport complex subunit E [candidate division WOR-3 bacterium]
MTSKKPSRLGFLVNPIVRENAVLILMIGLCPVLATSTSARDALGMSAAASFVLIFSNVVVALVRKFVQPTIRIPIFIIIISTFVTIIDYVLQAYQPSLYQVLGVFVPLIVVNCIILGRAEAFAYGHGVFDSFLDGLGNSLGFTLVLVVLGSLREFFAVGTVFGYVVTPAWYRSAPMLFMIFPPGAFLLIGILKALVAKFKLDKR